MKVWKDLISDISGFLFFFFFFNVPIFACRILLQSSESLPIGSFANLFL